MDRNLISDDIQSACATAAALTYNGRSNTMNRKQFWPSLALGALALAVWGCAEAGPTDPGGATPPSFARATTVTGYSSASDPALLAWYNSEKARVAVAGTAEQPVYDSLVASFGPGKRWLNQASNGGVAQCYPQAYSADVQIIGPEGGNLVIGAHSYSVPARALSKYYVITGEAHAGTQVAVQFGPEGLGFAKETTLWLSYAKCSFPDGVKKQVAFTDNQWNIKEYESSTDDLLNQVLGGYVVHFSQYAVAW
jgi:hypothetical protein